MTSTVIQQRLLNHHLSAPPLPGPAAVVGQLGAVQAQDFAGALWAVAQRCGIPSQSEVAAAVSAGALLRTHVLRPTWHLVAPRDLRWMLALTGPRVIAGSAGRRRALELNAGVFGRCRQALVEALTGGVAMTRPETAAVLEAAGIRLDGQRLVHILMDAELAGVICSGPMMGKKHTHVLLDEWVAPAPMLQPEEAAAELATRYFSSHGPAQLSDFTWWSSLTAGQARKGIEGAGDRLCAIEQDGRKMWTAPGVSSRRISTPMVRLLPNYDEYVVAYRDRSDFYDKALDPQALRGGVMANIVAVDGRAVGHWSQSARARGVGLSVVPWSDWSARTWDALDVERQKLSQHLGVPVVMEPGRASQAYPGRRS